MHSIPFKLKTFNFSKTQSIKNPKNPSKSKKYFPICLKILFLPLKNPKNSPSHHHRHIFIPFIPKYLYLEHKNTPYASPQNISNKFTLFQQKTDDQSPNNMLSM